MPPFCCRKFQIYKRVFLFKRNSNIIGLNQPLKLLLTNCCYFFFSFELTSLVLSMASSINVNRQRKQRKNLSLKDKIDIIRRKEANAKLSDEKLADELGV